MAKHSGAGVSRSCGSPLNYGSRKRATFIILLAIGVVSVLLFGTTNSRLPREDTMEQRLAEMQAHVGFLDALYRARQEDIMLLQSKNVNNAGNNNPNQIGTNEDDSTTTITPELNALLKNISGTRAAAGFQQKNWQHMRTSFVYQLLPHLMTDVNSIRPAYHMSTNRSFVDVVLGIPTVKRDKENYLMITLTHLISGLTDEEFNSTLIVVFVGETDLEYVVNVARRIESMFPREVECGLIEVLSPSAAYYPDLEALQPNLGDPAKRFQWRTKQNLDTIYIMAYAQTKGTFYLMLEDDIIAKKDYMQKIKEFTALTTVSNTDWTYIEFCQIGGIGKMFRSSNILHFITYVQLFYDSMPIDWLLESYLADKVCGIAKASKQCEKSKLAIRPKFKSSLFQHIGLYSSLKGKIQKIKDTHFGMLPTYYPHNNPPLENLRSDIGLHLEHSLQKAYDGQSFFWGIKPKAGNIIEFSFTKPTALEKFTFRSGNVEHVSDKFYDTVVEVLPAAANASYTQVGAFDEFGIADGELQNFGLITAIRLRVIKDSSFWVILSEIELKVVGQEEDKI